jgi:hypothetical protein
MRSNDESIHGAVFTKANAAKSTLMKSCIKNTNGMYKSRMYAWIMSNDPQPNGKCWCCCGEPAGRKSFFKQGHDRVAESAVIMLKYGGVPEFMAAHGYGPGRINIREEIERWRASGGKPR